MNTPFIKRNDLVHPELSYQIIGCAFEVFNELGGGHLEKYYQRALSLAFKQKNIPFAEQVPYPLTFKGAVIGRNYLDFLVDGKVIIELKKDTRFSKAHIDQVNNYLKVSNLQLALLINFGKDGVIHKRLLNINS